MKHKEFENDFSDDADLEKSDPNQEITTMGHIVNRIISKMSNVTGRGQQNNNNNSNNNHGNNNPNQNNNDNSNDQSKKSKSQHQIVTMDTGLHVDHALHFVEYTDHIHDLVFEDTEGYNDTSMWIKQMSTDTQSIDISNQDPIKMTYNDSMYNKNGTSLGGSLSQHVLSNRRRYSSSNSSLNHSRFLILKIALVSGAQLYFCSILKIGSAASASFRFFSSIKSAILQFREASNT